MKTRIIVALSVAIVAGLAIVGYANCGNCGTHKAAPAKTEQVKGCSNCPCPMSKSLATLNLTEKQKAKIAKARKKFVATVSSKDHGDNQGCPISGHEEESLKKLLEAHGFPPRELLG